MDTQTELSSSYMLKKTTFFLLLIRIFKILVATQVRSGLRAPSRPLLLRRQRHRATNQIPQACIFSGTATLTNSDASGNGCTQPATTKAAATSIGRVVRPEYTGLSRWSSPASRRTPINRSVAGLGLDRHSGRWAGPTWVPRVVASCSPAWDSDQNITF